MESRAAEHQGVDDRDPATGRSEMTSDELLRALEERAGISDRDEAEHTAIVVLQALCVPRRARPAPVGLRRARADLSHANEDTTEEEGTMAVHLNRTSYEFAQQLVQEGRVVLDERDDWSEHQPSTREENEYISEHGIRAYAKWHLGYDDEQDEDNKGRYKFPYGDFKDVHLCAILAAESRAAQRKYTDIQMASAHLHGMLEQIQKSQARSGRA
jgi:hypothetical protein